MQPDPRVQLEDTEQAAAEIAQFTEGMAYVDWHGDALTKRAVGRDFEILGEALNRLSRTAPEIAKRIPKAGWIISFRNVLAREYHRVEPDTVWNIAKTHLPELRRIANELLAELDPGDREPELDP